MAADLAEARFPAMGSQAHVIIVGPPDSTMVDAVRARLAELEALWSRFRPDSELQRLNGAAGQWVQLSAPTAALVHAAVRAWEITGGLFDPTVLTALENAGYDCSFDTLPTDLAPVRQDLEPAAAPGCADIAFRGTGGVRLLAGVRLDLGGIGKGYAADLLVQEILDGGAAGACVNLGGDVRVGGQSPEPYGWTVGVADETDPDTDTAGLVLVSGAVATSTRLRRRWWRDGQQLHHLIDPATGSPSASRVATVTVVAAEALWAEVLAKAALIAGHRAGAALLEGFGIAGLMITDSGTFHPAGDWERFATWTAHCGGTWRAPVG